MSKRLQDLLLLLIIILAATYSSLSQDGKQFIASAGANYNFPIGGKFGDYWASGWGVTAVFEYKITPEITVGVEGGYFSWSPANAADYPEITFTSIPVFIVANYYFEKATQFRPYVGLEFGIDFIKHNQKYQGYENTIVDASKPAFSPVVGILVPFGESFFVNAAVKYTTILTDNENSSFLSLNASISFPF